jgi:hypothetical protein
MIDAVAAGHTHFVNHNIIKGVPIVQSASSSSMFGRIDLIFDTATRTVVPAKTRWFGGVHLHGHAVPWRWDGEQGRIVQF